MQNIEQRGGVRMEQHRRVLITQARRSLIRRSSGAPEANQRDS